MIDGNEISWGGEPNEAIHQLTVYKDGDWIVFTCPHEGCEGYERRINWRTGESRHRHTNTITPHSGVYMPEQLVKAVLESGRPN